MCVSSSACGVDVIQKQLFAETCLVLCVEYAIDYYQQQWMLHVTVAPVLLWAISRGLCSVEDVAPFI